MYALSQRAQCNIKSENLKVANAKVTLYQGSLGPKKGSNMSIKIESFKMALWLFIALFLSICPVFPYNWRNSDAREQQNC